MVQVAPVRCHQCKEKFDKDVRHINENKKFGHHFFCSKSCESQYRNKQVKLYCERLDCPNTFWRSPKKVSLHNYCSSSCAAYVNNTLHLKGTGKRSQCILCGQEFASWKAIKYCSQTCYWRSAGRRKYTKEGLLLLIQKSSRKLGRVPGRREMRKISEACRKEFGSWNKAVTAAGLTPNRSHDDRMYKRSVTKAKDGHVCDSVSEVLIDNWLYEHGISHERNAKYPKTNHRADWKIQDGTFVEYFGLAQDSPRYDRTVQEKIKLCKGADVSLIALYPRDLYPKLKLDIKFRKPIVL